MSALKEVLAKLLAEGLLTEEVNSQIDEAYQFDISDYAEQIDGANVSNGELNTEVAKLTEELEAAKAEIVNVKAMNFDKLVNGSPNENEEPQNDSADGVLSLDELIESATVEKD